MAIRGYDVLIGISGLLGIIKKGNRGTQGKVIQAYGKGES